ncbi:MAG: alpha/beta hydrolase [Syntrophales bacterium]|nr:alpha/beta hydrolase [Syntrophales bacterium]
MSTKGYPITKTTLRHLYPLLLSFLFLNYLLSDALGKDKPSVSARPVVVMIHGMFVGPWCWEKFKTYFEKKGFICLTPYLRFHDKTWDQPPDERLVKTTIEDYLEDVEKTLSLLNEKPIIIGHSMGGLLAQMLAERNRAKAIVLISPAPPWGTFHISTSIFKLLWLNKPRLISLNKPLKPNFEGAVYSSLHLLPREDQVKAFSKFTYESPKVVAQIALWFLDFKKSTYVDKNKVTCPALTIVGSEDRLTPPALVRKIHERYRNVSTYIEFPHHSHMLIAEPGWETVAAAIVNWIESLH